MTKKASLEHIAQEIRSCTLCQAGTTGQAVPGEGNPDAKIVFVGEAPGKKEAATGRPFIGRSGTVLREAMHNIGFSEKDMFITSVGKYLPVRGTPSATQIAHGREHLTEQLHIIHPKLVVLLGSVAVQGVLQEKVPVKSVHGTIREKEGIFYFLTVHPAAALRFPLLRKVFLEDFQKIAQFSKKEHLL